MRKQFKPAIKHDVVTQTYTIRDKKGVVIQVPDVIIDELDNYYKAERDTLIDDLTWYKAKVDRLEHENKRLTGRTRKLTTHRTMWDNLKDWRRDMLEIDKNDTQLISLGLVMDELEHNWLYREEK